MLEHVKNGRSMFQNSNVCEEYQIPIIKNQDIRHNLEKFIDKSLI